MRGMLLLSGLIFGVVAAGCSSQSASSNSSPEIKEITNSIGMKLRLVPAGKFMMGSPPGEEGADDNEQQHEVAISKAYYLGTYEVTQEQFQKVMGKNPAYYQKRVVFNADNERFPVERIEWKDAEEFCRKLSEAPEEKAAGRVYRLPSEAEWEYACRAGSKTAFCFGNDAKLAKEYAWFELNSASQMHPVGKKKPNAWGFYDMHGGVWEWCSDWYGPYSDGAATDPSGPKEGKIHVSRGGSSDMSLNRCRSAGRIKFAPDSGWFNNVGFRVAMTEKESPE